MIVFKNNYILWITNHASSNKIHGSINKLMCVREFSRVTLNWPSKGASLQQFVRSNNRLFYRIKLL